MISCRTLPTAAGETASASASRAATPREFRDLVNATVAPEEANPRTRDQGPGDSWRGAASNR